mmetsp:Transcript_29185/g.45690  ORF Transcript_29185/g.45690 Transcript_29185/m.45690 type:complete len:228 (-) Transcript_29185:22-705(-)
MLLGSLQLGKDEMFPPDAYGYGRYLDKISDRRRAPRCVISRHVSESVLQGRPTAAARYQPGQYKADRDFVMDRTREVRKDVCSDFERAPSYLFDPRERADADGILRGIRHAGAGMRWFNPTAPGQYKTDIDGTDCPSRVKWSSVPAWSQRKGEPQENVRALQKSRSTPGPGHYSTPTRFDEVNRVRTKQLQNIARRDAAQKDDAIDNYYATIFGSVRASGRRVGIPR